ncbi:MAG TPA: hypothetical protein VLJ18_02280 [Thermoanaerobaculia bacterium]|nr:hypothetical protein [Thermoanaerobaculia bacterium]
MKAVGFAAALVLAAGGFAAGQETPAPRVIAKESVLVRSVKVVLTDKSGKPLRLAPAPSDFEVFEDGVSATLLGIEPLFEHAGLKSIPPPDQLEEAARAAAREPGTAGSPHRLPQVFYFDTAFLAHDSVLVTVRNLKGRVDRFLQLGPVEIVVADPQPRIFLPETSDAPTFQSALDRLALNVVGRDLVTRLRKRAAQGRGGGPAAINALLLEEEKLLVRTTLARLAGWANTRQGLSGVLYLVSDGFDLSVDFYAESQREDVARAGEFPGPGQEVVPSAFLGQLLPNSSSPMVDSIAALLASRGWVVMPLSLRGYVFAASRALDSADNPGGFSQGMSYMRPSQMLAGRVALEHALDPLEAYAEATGGELVSSPSRLEAAVDRLSDSFLFTYQLDRPPDGKVHRLKIRSRSKEVVVRTARVVSTGTPVEVAGTRALDALLERAPAGDLPVFLRIEAGQDQKGRKKRSGRFEVRVKLGDLPHVLEKVGAGQMRVTVAVWEPRTLPFVRHDEKPLEGSTSGGDTWIYTAPIEWPARAKRLSVFVEELKTGASGSAIADFPAD